ncbi:hypothetical protein [Tenacibaculum ascidiaceicola]|uniref:hypothetical protein n=1 Tax=Tenacibaculum ascidiaceicola TaxID=1699411 RepID=UPI003894AF24
MGLLIYEDIRSKVDKGFPCGDRFKMITYWLFKKHRRINHNLKNSKQIRASVITHWL